MIRSGCRNQVIFLGFSNRLEDFLQLVFNGFSSSFLECFLLFFNEADNWSNLLEGFLQLDNEKIKRDFSFDVYITYYLNDPQMRFFCRLYLFWLLAPQSSYFGQQFSNFNMSDELGACALTVYLAYEYLFPQILQGITCTNKTTKVSEWELLIWFRSLKRLLYTYALSARAGITW